MKNRSTSVLAAEFPVPSALHEVLGNRQTAGGIAAILLAILAFALVWGGTILGGNQWYHWIAFLLAADIVAGAVANLTPGTNNFYAERPTHRWVFIAAHVHLLAIGWLMGWDMAPLILVWLATIACAALVNLTGNRAVIGGLCLVLGLLVLPLLQLEGLPLLVSTLFFFKVSYSFAVNHYPASS